MSSNWFTHTQYQRLISLFYSACVYRLYSFVIKQFRFAINLLRSVCFTLIIDSSGNLRFVCFFGSFFFSSFFFRIICSLLLFYGQMINTSQQTTNKHACIRFALSTKLIKMVNKSQYTVRDYSNWVAYTNTNEWNKKKTSTQIKWVSSFGIGNDLRSDLFLCHS